MKELEIDSVKILKSLKKDGFVVIKPICLNCLNELLQIVSEHYVNVEWFKETGYLDIRAQNGKQLALLYVKEAD